MPHLLKFDGNGHIETGVNLTLMSLTRYRCDIGLRVNGIPSSDINVFGQISGAQARLRIRTTGGVSLRITNSSSETTWNFSATNLFNNEFHVLTITRDGNNHSALLDDDQVGGVSSQSAVRAVQSMALGLSAGTTSAAFELYFLTVNSEPDGSGTVLTDYQANLSGGTGTELVNTAGENGTQAGTWPADDAEWIEYAAPAVPVITVNPDTEAVLVGGAFVGPTVTALDVDGTTDISTFVQPSGDTLDSSEAGTDVRRYNVESQSNPGIHALEKSFTLIVSAVADTEAPVLTMIGDNPATVYVGETYIDPGVTSTDNVDATETIYSVGSIDTSSVQAGQTLTYNDSDAAGNPATPIVRTVNVVAAPTGITFSTREDDFTLDESSSDTVIDNNNDIISANWVTNTIDGTEQFQAYFAVEGVNGKAPTFKLNESNLWVFGDDEHFWWSYTGDRGTWQRFDNIGDNVDTQFRDCSNNAAFTQDKVYVAHMPHFGTRQTRDAVNAIKDHALVSPFASVGTADLVVGQTASATSADGLTTTAQDIFGFKISSPNAPVGGGRKLVKWLVAGVHPQEMYGPHQLWGAVDWYLSGSAEATAALREFDVYVLPLCFPDATAIGLRRTIAGLGEGINSNRWMDSDTYAPIALLRAIIFAETPRIDVWIDYHTAVKAADAEQYEIYFMDTGYSIGLWWTSKNNGIYADAIRALKPSTNVVSYTASDNGSPQNPAGPVPTNKNAEDRHLAVFAISTEVSAASYDDSGVFTNPSEALVSEYGGFTVHAAYNIVDDIRAAVRWTETPNTLATVSISGATTGDAGETIALDATVTDPDAADIHTYTWRVISGTGTLSATDTEDVTVTGPTLQSQETTTVGLIVNDGTGDSAEVTHSIVFAAEAIIPTSQQVTLSFPELASVEGVYYAMRCINNDETMNGIVSFDSSGVAVINTDTLDADIEDEVLLKLDNYDGSNYETAVCINDVAQVEAV